jgi:hypothetical protein
MNEAERLIQSMHWLGQQLSGPTPTERRIALCEQARDTAHDPDIQILWERKAQQLRDKRTKEAN